MGILRMDVTFPNTTGGSATACSKSFGRFYGVSLGYTNDNRTKLNCKVSEADAQEAFAAAREDGYSLAMIMTCFNDSRRITYRNKGRAAGKKSIDGPSVKAINDKADALMIYLIDPLVQAECVQLVEAGELGNAMLRMKVEKSSHWDKAISMAKKELESSFEIHRFLPPKYSEHPADETVEVSV